MRPRGLASRVSQPPTRAGKHADCLVCLGRDWGQRRGPFLFSGTRRAKSYAFRCTRLADLRSVNPLVLEA